MLPFCYKAMHIFLPFTLFMFIHNLAKRLIKHTGFGNAAGLLMSRGLLGGAIQPLQYEYSEDEDSDTEEYLQSRL